MESSSNHSLVCFRLRIRTLKTSFSLHWSGSSELDRMLGLGNIYIINSAYALSVIKRCLKGHHSLCVFGVCRLTGQVADEPVTDVSEIFHLESSHPKMSFTCRFQRAILTVMSRIFLITVGEITRAEACSRVRSPPSVCFACSLSCSWIHQGCNTVYPRIQMYLSF